MICGFWNLDLPLANVALDDARHCTGVRCLAHPASPAREHDRKRRQGWMDHDITERPSAMRDQVAQVRQIMKLFDERMGEASARQADPLSSNRPPARLLGCSVDGQTMPNGTETKFARRLANAPERRVASRITRHSSGVGIILQTQRHRPCATPEDNKHCGVWCGIGAMRDFG
jgi:hypothetical protein